MNKTLQAMIDVFEAKYREDTGENPTFEEQLLVLNKWIEELMQEFNKRNSQYNENRTADKESLMNNSNYLLDYVIKKRDVVTRDFKLSSGEPQDYRNFNEMYEFMINYNMINMAEYPNHTKESIKALSIIFQIDFTEWLLENNMVYKESPNVDLQHLNYKNLCEFLKWKQLRFESEIRVKNERLDKIQRDINPHLDTPAPQQLQVNNTRPIFLESIREYLFNKLKVYFIEENHDSLKSLIDKGENAPAPIIFKGNANQLIYLFKELYDSDLITGIQKKDFEIWIRSNFKYAKSDVVKTSSSAYINKFISKKDSHCKKPIDIDGILARTK